MKKPLIYSEVEIIDESFTDLASGEPFTTHSELKKVTASDTQDSPEMPQHLDLDFSHEEIAYGAFCIYQDEQRRGKYSGQDAHWFMAINRLKDIRRSKLHLPSQ